jgi:hypothetical protein
MLHQKPQRSEQPAMAPTESKAALVSPEVVKPPKARSRKINAKGSKTSAVSDSKYQKPDVAPAKIDKSKLTFGEPRRLRDKAHLKYVASQPCLICGRNPADAHHLRFTQPRALGLKVSDEFTVPLCRVHHRDVHSVGDEVAWWERRAIDPLATSRVLWVSTRCIG